MTAKQILVAHIAEHHAGANHGNRPPKGATLVELQRWHARIHHRYSSTTHFHEVDGLGKLAGPEGTTTTRRPSGWYTGEGVVVLAPRSPGKRIS